MGYITDEDENNAYVWGDNPNGMLSIGDSDGEEYPTRVKGFDGKKIKKVIMCLIIQKNMKKAKG